MANKYAKQRYADALRSHRCYAKRHGYTYSQEELREGLAHPTLQKPMAVQKWVDDARCKWVAWFDADFFVVQGERGLDEWLYRDASLVIKDDHTIINNAAFILRASSWVSTVFMKVWATETATGKWPWTDNGSMIETILRLFVPGYKALGCGQQGARFEECHMKTLLKTFGPTPSEGSRGGNGLVLVSPAHGWYGYGCTTHGDFAAGTKSIDCTESSEWWKGEAAHSDYVNPPAKLGAKKASDFFTPPNKDGTLTGKLGSTFGLHAKAHKGLPEVVRQAAFRCATTADPGCTCEEYSPSGL